jgi:hypothetical protein
MNISTSYFLKLLITYLFRSIENIPITGPRCIPLTSKNIEANPYHPSLLSIPGGHIRHGFGLPALTDSENGINMPATKCPHGIACYKTIVNSFTTTISKGFSITLSKSKSHGISYSGSGSMGSSNSYSKSMGRTLDETISKSIIITDDASFSDQIGQTISNVHGKSTGYSNMKSDDSSNTDTQSTKEIGSEMFSGRKTD